MTDDTMQQLWGAPVRRRLVRLCAVISGDAAVAEDLAQETLLEAWRSAQKRTIRPVWSSIVAGVRQNDDDARCAAALRFVPWALDPSSRLFAVVPPHRVISDGRGGR